MPTLAGIRRRGYTPEALRDFCDRIGLAKRNSVVEVELLEHCLREDLNRRAPRFMGVLDPVKVVLVNWPEGKVEMLDAVNNPEDASQGTRAVPFSARRSSSTATTSARCRRRSTTASRPARRCACAGRT